MIQHFMTQLQCNFWLKICKNTKSAIQLCRLLITIIMSSIKKMYFYANKNASITTSDPRWLGPLVWDFQHTEGSLCNTLKYIFKDHATLILLAMFKEYLNFIFSPYIFSGFFLSFSLPLEEIFFFFQHLKPYYILHSFRLLIQQVLEFFSVFK